MIVDIKEYLDEKRKKHPNIAFAKIFFLGKVQITCDGKNIPPHLIEPCSSERLESLKLGEVDMIKKDHELVCIIQYRRGNDVYKKILPPEDGEVSQGDLWPSY